MKFELIDCCPVPQQLAPTLRQIKRDTGCVYQSVYRGQDPNAQQYLTGGPPCSKHNQAWIFAHYPPGVANPPGRSTHELRNDGVAYRLPAFVPLPWWCCGIDVDDGHVKAFIQAAARHGWTASITYPTSRVEYHHVNFRKAPALKLFPTLKEGSRGPRVKIVSRRLAFVKSPTGQHYLKHSYWTFNREVANALKQFQIDHHQKPDGVYGPQTARQLAAAVRFHKKH